MILRSKNNFKYLAFPFDKIWHFPSKRPHLAFHAPFVISDIFIITSAKSKNDLKSFNLNALDRFQSFSKLQINDF